jgi:hypothetical protein
MRQAVADAQDLLLCCRLEEFRSMPASAFVPFFEQEKKGEDAKGAEEN